MLVDNDIVLLYSVNSDVIKVYFKLNKLVTQS